MKKILLRYETETLVWGRRERVERRTLVLETGRRFAAWDVEERDGAVLFSVASVPRVHFTAENFILREGEKRAFSCSESYECAEDCIEDITTGEAEIVG